MIEESLVKSNFIGRDGFRWWVGQIAPIESWKSQADGKGWGHRYKVRILGYHPYDTARLSDDDLPWAGVMMPVTAGSGGGQFAQSANIKQGDVVVGFFLDGDNGQIPMIMGSFGRTQYTPTNEYISPFVPYTGHTNNASKVSTQVLASNESTGQGNKNQPTPRSGLSEKQVSQLKESGSSTEAVEGIPTANGIVVKYAHPCDEGNFISSVTGILENLTNVLSEGTNFLQDVQQAIKKIQNLTKGLVGKLFNKLYEYLIPLIKQGLSNLYSSVFASTLKSLKDVPGASDIAEAAGLDAQELMLAPVNALQNQILCGAGKVVLGIIGTITEMVESTVMQIVNFGLCTAEQFIGNLLNKIIDDIVAIMEEPLKAISQILSPAFKVKDFLLSVIDSIKSVSGFFSCNQSKEKCNAIKEWTIGYGPKNRKMSNDTFNRILNNANNFISPTSYSKPDCGEPTECGSPTLSFFGGSGSGAAGKAILGSVVSNTPGLSGPLSSIEKTGSIIGIEITNPGSGYETAPPIISFEDSCNYGYGAVGRAIVDYDRNSSTFGKVTGAYIISEGENYPVFADEEFTVDDTYVLFSGSGYSSDDTATDNFGIKYGLIVEGGKIISATPINKIKIDSSPVITINSSTGNGAILKALIGRYNPPQEEVVSVIDCVT